jgi:NAD(P)-dependent dehydrogenase (short-subunit alcohol dehydrogenase family)
VVPVVVGGGSGIGRAIVEAYREAGAAPVVWDIAGSYDIECDVADPAAIDRALSETLARFGVPDELSVTAGIGHSGLLLDEAVGDWDRVLNVNTRGPWLVMRAVARSWIAENRPGSIVAISSVSAHLVDRAMGLYCASKAALSMLVKVAALEWAPFGIRVNAVGPGVTQTPMLGRAPTDSGWLQGVKTRTALGRLGEPADIVAAVLALHGLSWVTGQVLDCDGGLSLHSPIDAFGETERARAQS